MFKPVLLGKLVVRPVPPELTDKVGCTHCRENPARWDFGQSTPWSYVCSRCFLYHVATIKEQRERVDALIRAAEHERGVTFHRDSNGALIEERDADCIAFAIVASNKAIQARHRSHGLR